MLPPVARQVTVTETLSPVLPTPYAVKSVACLGLIVIVFGEMMIHATSGPGELVTGSTLSNIRQLLPAESHSSSLRNCRPTTSANKTGPSRTSMDSAPALNGTSE